MLRNLAKNKESKYFVKFFIMNKNWTACKYFRPWCHWRLLPGRKGRPMLLHGRQRRNVLHRPHPVRRLLPTEQGRVAMPTNSRMHEELLMTSQSPTSSARSSRDAPVWRRAALDANLGDASATKGSVLNIQDQVQMPEQSRHFCSDCQPSRTADERVALPLKLFVRA